MICAPFGVTMTSSSMRAADTPSVAGTVRLRGEHHARLQLHW